MDEENKDIEEDTDSLQSMNTIHEPQVDHAVAHRYNSDEHLKVEKQKG